VRKGIPDGLKKKGKVRPKKKENTEHQMYTKSKDLSFGTARQYSKRNTRAYGETRSGGLGEKPSFMRGAGGGVAGASSDGGGGGGNKTKEKRKWETVEKKN